MTIRRTLEIKQSEKILKLARQINSLVLKTDLDKGDYAKLLQSMEIIDIASDLINDSLESRRQDRH